VIKLILALEEFGKRFPASNARCMASRWIAGGRLLDARCHRVYGQNGRVARIVAQLRPASQA